jgi:hypothetical protein
VEIKQVNVKVAPLRNAIVAPTCRHDRREGETHCRRPPTRDGRRAGLADIGPEGDACSSSSFLVLKQ